MYIYPDFYKSFSCAGASCRNTCCAGWDINIDGKTADYYSRLEGEFGDFLRKNINSVPDKEYSMIRLTADKRCPFLDENGLCRIYIECGEEHMSKTCQSFPRRQLDQCGHSIRGISLSCEEVLRMLFDRTEPIRFCVKGDTKIETMGDIAIYDLAQFIAWGMEVLQDETIPFDIALSTVMSVSMEVERHYKNRDFEAFESAILQAPQTQEAFLSEAAKRTAESENWQNAAWSLIFGVTDAFCQILKVAEIDKCEDFLWSEEFFAKSDKERLDCLMRCWQNGRKDPVHTGFMRRLAAVFFQGHSLTLVNEDGTAIYLRDMCNYMILTELLPLTWEGRSNMEKGEFLSRLGLISRQFEQANAVKKFVWPVIQDLFKPDFHTYVLAFAVLYGNQF